MVKGEIYDTDQKVGKYKQVVLDESLDDFSQ
jgi:hypothetical protein